MKRRLFLLVAALGSAGFCVYLLVGPRPLGAARAAGPNRSQVISREAARTWQADWGQMIRYFTGETFATRDVFAAIAVVQPGKAVHRAHRHAEEEYLIVMQGTGQWSLAGKQLPAKPYDVLYVEPWVYHGLVNTGSEPLVFAVIKYNGKGVPPPRKPDNRPNEL